MFLRASRYTDNYVTDKEFETLSPRVQEHIRRLAASNAAASGGMYTGFYTPAQAPTRFKRVGELPLKSLNDSVLHLLMHRDFVDWLRDKIYFERLVKKDPYIKSRLGFTAPNVFVMVLY